MDHAEQKTEFEKLTARAKKAGLLRGNYPEHGVAILILPPAPVSPPASADPEPPPNPAPPS